MANGRRGWLVVVIAAVLASTIAALAGWLVVRTRPDAVGPRFVARLVERHPQATVAARDGGIVRVALPSGVYVDVRLSAVIAACGSDRLGCSGTIDRGLADIDRVAALAGEPERRTLRPIVLAEAGGAAFGYLAEPLVGPFELRYALVSGLASTFVTGAIAGRLGLTGAALRDAALAGLAQDGAVGLARIDGPAGVALFRVTADGDPAASLVDPARMKGYARALGARKLYAILPTRNALLLAAASDDAGHALESLQKRLRIGDVATLDGGVLAYDADAAPGDGLSIARLPPAPLAR